jgi:hypothetical protein
MSKTHHCKATTLTVDTGPGGESARFYRLVVGPRGAAPCSCTVSDEILVPDGDELRTAHRHVIDDAA